MKKEQDSESSEESTVITEWLYFFEGLAMLFAGTLFVKYLDVGFFIVLETIGWWTFIYLPVFLASLVFYSLILVWAAFEFLGLETHEVKSIS